VKKKSAHFHVSDPKEFTIKMLNWVNRFNIFCFLDNNGYNFEKPSFDCKLAAGARDSVILHKDDLFRQLDKFHSASKDWIFGHINYPSSTKDETGFPDGFFFLPEIIVTINGSDVFIESHSDTAESIYDSILASGSFIHKRDASPIHIQSRFSKEEYINIIKSLRRHIQRGDCYEINFCQDFFAHQVEADPLYLFIQLNKISPNPFAAFYRIDDKYCLCASPERFIKKSGQTIISQPIKGTSKRNLQDATADDAARSYLLSSNKEKSENVMVVDLVRNDMSRICTEGSVTVKELFGIYSFPQVHQMISTIQGRVDENTSAASIIEACFPMGSMTGAPKVRVMQLIEQYEKFPRGLFSGTIGYFNPEGDFDFNVVIRSLFYNADKKYLSYKAGGGITFYSDPEQEYEECMTKASAIQSILGTG
jgi:para-aminobenzoate synthetase component I